jgi:hypothetical protein
MAFTKLITYVIAAGFVCMLIVTGIGTVDGLMSRQ